MRRQVHGLLLQLVALLQHNVVDLDVSQKLAVVDALVNTLRCCAKTSHGHVGAFLLLQGRLALCLIVWLTTIATNSDAGAKA